MSSGKQQGFTYLSALFLVGAMGVGLVAIGESWSHARQREKEAELIWIGEQFRQAIGLYYQRSPGVMKRYPEKLEDLLEDRRFLTVQRYIRKVYDDPMVANASWGLVPAPGGGIMGVYSMAPAKPIRAVAHGRENHSSASATSYRDWVFSYSPPLTGSAPTR